MTLYPVPAIALLPLLILWFDTSPASLVVVSVYSVTLPTAINLSAGLKSVNPTILLVGQDLPALHPLTFHEHLDHFGAGELCGRVFAAGEHLAHLRPREEDVRVRVVRAGLR